MELPEFTELDVTTWPEESLESGGRREKFWRKAPDGDLWLLKLPNRPVYKHRRPDGTVERREEEHWPLVGIEHLALRLAAAAKIPAAHSELCFWHEIDGRVRRGIVVKRLEGERQSGAQVLQGYRPDFNKDDKPRRTFELVYAALADLEQRQPNVRVLDDFFQMVLFDFWIGNADRHPFNWGISGTRLTPMYDPAACLGSRLMNDHALVRTEGQTPAAIAAFIADCRSGFGDGVSGFLPMNEVLVRLRTWPQWFVQAKSSIARFRDLLEPANAFVRQYPEILFSDGRKQLVMKLLRERLRMLEECP